MHTISANELKKKGISVICGSKETLITVRGERKYVILDTDSYEKLRQAELALAVIQTKYDIENGDYICESVEDHIKRITE